MMKAYKKLIVPFLVAVALCIIPIGAVIFYPKSQMVVFAEESTVSGNEPSEPDTEICNCDKKCTQMMIAKECVLCRNDFLVCEYQEPKVKIMLSTGSGWYKKSAKVQVAVNDTLETGNFIVDTVEAKIGQNGMWEDITTDRSLTITENCSVYVKVLDTKGNAYTANKNIACFDNDKPTLNGAINDGLLSVQAYDTTSKITIIYVNGHEFKDLTNGTLAIRLQQFDSGYEYFTIQAMDEAGNLSEVYKMKNPYYQNPETERKNAEEGNVQNPLPISAEPTKPSDAKASVIEHTNEEVVKETVKSDTDVKGEEEKGGKEFYTIQTKSKKVFYLVIDKEQTENNVYLLTEVSENDLLNFSESESEVLPQNSAVVESALPSSVQSSEKEDNAEEDGKEVETIEVNSEISEEDIESETTGNGGTYMIIILTLVAVGGVYYYLKFIKGKNITFDDDEDEFEEEDTTEYEKDNAEEIEPASDSEEE